MVGQVHCSSPRIEVLSEALKAGRLTAAATLFILSAGLTMRPETAEILAVLMIFCAVLSLIAILQSAGSMGGLVLRARIGTLLRYCGESNGSPEPRECVERRRLDTLQRVASACALAGAAHVVVCLAGPLTPRLAAACAMTAGALILRAHLAMLARAE